MAPTVAVEGQVTWTSSRDPEAGRNQVSSSSSSVRFADPADQVEADASTANSFRRLWSREFVELLVIQFVFGLGYSVFNLLPKYLRITMVASASEIGVASGSALIAAVLAAPFAAVWLGAGARRLPARAGVLLFSASAAAFVLVHRVATPLLCLRAMHGFSFALLQAVVVTRVAEIVPEDRLGQAIGLTGLAGLVTNALAPMFAEPLARAAGWRAVFIVAALLAGAALFPASRMRDVPAGTRLRWRSAFRLLERGPGAVLVAAAVCGMAFGVMFTFTQPLAIERGARDVGAMFSGYALAAASVRLLFGSVADRWGRRKVSVTALLAYAAVVGLAAWLSPGTLFLLGLGLGTAHGSLYPALNALAFEVTPADGRALIATGFSAAFSVGNAVSVLALGPVADRWGYASIFVGCAVVTVLGAVALASTGPKRRRALM